MTNEEKYTNAFMQAFDIDAGSNFKPFPPGIRLDTWVLLPRWKKPLISCSSLMTSWI